jgi:hypothetical protein
MDYTTVPRLLIYRERRSLEEFGIYEDGCIMRPLFDAIFDFDFIRAPNAEERALWCMNNAFYICTMFFLERDPKWRYDQYKRIATPEKNGFPIDLHFVTLSLVGLLLSRLEEKLPLLSAKGKVRNSFIMSMQENEEHRYIFYHLSDRLETDTFKHIRIPNSTFAPRVINAEAVHDVLMDSNFNWVKFTNYWEERSLRDIVNALGKTEEEKHYVIDILKQTSQGFYAKGFRCEQVDDLLDNIDNEIHLQYNPEEAAVGEDENDEQNHYLELKPYEEARIEMLEHEKAKLREEINHLKEYIKGAITIDVDNEVVDLGEFGSIVDNAPKTYGDANDKVERNYSADSQQENGEDENLRQKLADAQKTIEEQVQTINEQQTEITHLTTLNEVLTNQNTRFDEENPEMDIDEGTALSIKECIIFFSSIMDCNLNKEDISQMNLARLISKFTQWPKESIRPQIVDINTEREKNAKDHTAFSDGVHQAAVNVCALIENAMTGLKKNTLPYSCKQAVENICKIYKSPGRKIEPHEIAEAKKNLKKI